MSRSRFLRVSLAFATLVGLVTAFSSVVADRRVGIGVGGADHHCVHHLPHRRGRIRGRRLTGRVPRPDRPAERGGRGQRAQAGAAGHRRPDQPDGRSRPPCRRPISKGAFGIVSQSPLFFLAAKYPEQAGRAGDRLLRRRPGVGHAALHQHVRLRQRERRPQVPGQHPDRRLPEAARGHGPRRPTATASRRRPAARPSARRSRSSTPGARSGVLDTTVPFGGVDFTSDGAASPSRTGVNAMVPAMDDNSNYALATALKQAGVKLKAALFATGYEPDVINSPAWSTLQGDYFLALFRPWSLPNAGTEQMQAAMEKYAHFTKSQFPTFGQYEAWAGRRPHDQGPADGRPQPDPGRGHQGPPQHQVLQRQRAAAGDPQLRDHLRAQPSPDLRLDHEGGERRGFVATSPTPTCGTDLPGHVHGDPSSTAALRRSGPATTRSSRR